MTPVLLKRLSAYVRRRRTASRPFFRRYPYASELSIHDADKRGLIRLDAGYFYNRIPKAANTTVATALGEGPRRRQAKEVGLRPSQLDEQDMAAFAACFKFTFVRNPYSRLLSAYLNKIGGRGEKAHYITAGESNASVPSFAEFCRYLDTGGLHANAHWAPQSSLLLIPLDDFDFVGRVESLGADLSEVLGRLELERREDYDSRGPKPTRADDRLAEHYTDECREIVARLYRTDFDLLGYDRRP